MLLVWRADSSDSCDDVYQCSGSGSHHVEAAPCCGGSRNRPFLGAVVRFLGAGIASTRESLAVVPIVDLVFCFLFASTLLSLYFECVMCSFWLVDVVFLGVDLFVVDRPNPFSALHRTWNPPSSSARSRRTAAAHGTGARGW